MITGSLAEELVLLAYDDNGAARGTGTNLDYGLAGALLHELSMAGRIEVAGKHVAVVDPTPTGDTLVDAALSRIAGDPKRRTPKAWVTRLAKHARQPVLDRLVAAGVLRRETDKLLWVFPRTRYPTQGGVQPPAKADARQRIRAAVTTTGPVDARTTALGGLVGALGWGRRVLPDLPKKQVKAELATMQKASWVATAVRKATEDAEATVVVTAAS